ncbi:hypothetical protein COCSADRAFT_179707 [Bipolaris sorokiniana ND90Pr]|uniref:Myb-like domain-containing protein n=1 Tax=Cochliobolus sativus (strain ND90Pr / ATCC 201652) TaxID=665912 RepID=M2SGT0_COCSN|nr:uncharacterized protein COCSADRAFT_179707 [Bipolaris sorokiniana ND90Pr]EMD66433.1 hypothetical protein COCSADRAFT_179707 [Bipolaris sorokiniana ND90Pr]
MAAFTSVPQNTSSEFRHYDPTLLKRTKSKPKAKKAEQNIYRNHGEVATQPLGLLLQESESNLPTVPLQIPQVQTTGHMEDVEGMNSEKCDLLGMNYRTDTHDFAKGDSHYQLRRELCDEGVMDHVTLGLALNKSFDGGGRDLHLITETGATDNHQNVTEFRLSNGSPNSQDKSQYLATTNGRDSAIQHRDLHTAVEYAFSIEDIEHTYHGPSVEDDTFSGVASVVNGSSNSQKRSHQSSVVDETISILEAVPNTVSDPELDRRRPSKRRRMAEREAQSPTIERTYMPKRTPLPHPYAKSSRLGTRESSILSSSNSGHEEYYTTSLAQPTTDFYGAEHRDGTYIQRSFEERLQARRSIPLSERLESEEDIGQESGRDVVNRQSSGRKAGETVRKRLSRNGSCIIPSSRSQRPRRRAWTSKMGCGKSNTALRSVDYNTAPTKPPQQVRLTQLHQSPISERLNTDKGSQSYLSASNSLGTTAEDGNNIDYESRSSMSCQITDLTLCAIPDDSSVVTAILHLPNPNHPLNLMPLGHKVIGEQGKVIRITQLSPDSWLLLGYRCNGSPSGLSNGGNLNEKQISSAHNDAVSHETDHSNDGWDEDDENGEEDIRGHSQRTHKLWLESEEVLLFSLKDKQGMEWEEICKRFPSRSPGAVKLRYYTLKKRS